MCFICKIRDSQDECVTMLGQDIGDALYEAGAGAAEVEHAAKAIASDIRAAMVGSFLQKTFATSFPSEIADVLIGLQTGDSTREEADAALQEYLGDPNASLATYLGAHIKEKVEASIAAKRAESVD